MTVNELVDTVTTNSACLYEIRCPNVVLFIIGVGGMKYLKCGKKSKYYMPCL